ncbi:MAG: hypothetical protein VYB61_03260 [Verrucomicrobiota bacterium]|nr:hypothetical protein [Verrucomicrobiota bacterium]
MDKLPLIHILPTVLFLSGPLLQSSEHAKSPSPSPKHAKLKLWNDSALQDWWKNHQGPEKVVSGAQELLATLQSAQQQHGLAKVLANKHFIGWLRHLAWLRLFPPDYSDHDYFSRQENFTAFRALSSRRELVNLAVTSMSCRDHPSGVLKVLCEIEKNAPKDLGQYNKLAVAFALVWDQPFPSYWPHPKVEGKNIPRGDSSVARRFSFMIDAMRDNRLVMDPRKLSIRELTFVVDTPVELRELAYVRQIKLQSPRKLEQLYSVVPYDHSRIQSETYSWPHGPYRLIEIGRRKGGICMDQAYFVAHAGKSMGIPTVLFMGQGRSGDHAWVGFLTGPRQWKLDAARWQGENYPVGLAFDPQTWRRFSDKQMEYSIKAEGDSPAVARGKLVLAWAALNRRHFSYPDILGAAAQSMPRSFEPWELKAEWLEENQPDLALHQVFWERWITHFSGEREMKARGQMQLLRILRKLGKNATAERIGRQIVAENKSKRFDLGIAIAADAIFDQQNAGHWEKAAKEYEQAIQRFSKQAGGHLFYNLVQPYVQACLSAGQPSHARAALKVADSVLRPEPRSILANDLGKLRGQVR